jgi:hypothetical protein
MNFPTALQYLKRGTPIARSSWAAELDLGPNRWMTYSGGVAWNNSTTGRNPVTPIDIKEADLRAGDWVIPPQCPPELPGRPNFPATETDAADTPLFDVFNPPCRI